MDEIETEIASAIADLNGKANALGITVSRRDGTEGPRKFRAAIEYPAGDGMAERIVQFDSAKDLRTIAAIIISGAAVQIIAGWWELGGKETD